MFGRFGIALAAGLLMVQTVMAEVKVTTTIYPLYSIVQEVGGKNVALHHLIPFGAEAHEFEPTPKDIAKLSKSDLFIISSETMEPWANKIIDSLSIADKSIDMSGYVVLRKMQAEDAHHEENHADLEHHHHEGGYDPHYWLSFGNYKRMIHAIEKLLEQKDPAGASNYALNAKRYLNKVEALEQAYIATMKQCKNKKVVVNHDAFGYLADEFGIEQFSVTGMSPDVQPSAKQIAELIKLVKREKIKTIFFEEFASDKVAKTISLETGAKADALRPVENLTVAESKQGIGYLDIMNANLFKLKEAMDCQ